MPSKLLFLLGAAGNTRFWQRVAELLKHPAGRIHVGWPGFGPTPPDQRVNGFDDLVAMVIAEVDGPTALIAQSMGGAIAMQVALARPDLITHLVLAVTSGGIDISDLGAQDWRPALFEADPSLPPWLSALKLDLTPKVGSVRMPTLLLWGDADPISPVAVGERLAQLLPSATLHVIENGTHDLADAFAAQVAPLIDAHLANAEHSRPSS